MPSCEDQSSRCLRDGQFRAWLFTPALPGLPLFVGAASSIVRTRYAAAVAGFLLTFAVLSGSANAQTASAFQSSARPFGLEIADLVMIGGTDERSATFNREGLPYFQNLINTNLSETKAQQNVAAMSLDPSKLVLSTNQNVRVYFVGEGAGYRNTLGYSLDGGGVASPTAELIFPDVSSSQSYYDPATGRDTRSNSAPLLAGDFVDLGDVAAGTALDFFLIANGANGGRTVWSADVNRNVDHIQHVVAFAQPGTPYLLIGFEDLYGGGDRDYNDALIVVDIGYDNIATLTGSPEPSSLLTATMLTFFGGWLRRRRKSCSVPDTRLSDTEI